MVECRYCGEVFYADPGRFGARCRRCREPLYERREASMPLPIEGAAGACATHPHNPSVGTCQRCGTYMCAVCRTRWQDRMLCLACVERALDEKDKRPEDVSAHRRQAALGLSFGASAWGLVLAGFLLLFLLRNSANAATWQTIAGLLGLVSFLPALFGVGQAVSALRARGSRMVMATSGLVLSATHVGVVLGLVLAGLWQR
jgi:hypothetical protein